MEAVQVTYLPGHKWVAKNKVDKILDHWYLELGGEHKYNACHENAWVLAEYLKKKGIKAKVVQGWQINDDISVAHSWLKVGKEHIDITPQHQHRDVRSYLVKKEYTFNQIDKEFRKESLRQGNDIVEYPWHSAFIFI